MPKLKYFDDYCTFGDKIILVEEFKTILQQVTLPNVSKHFEVSDFITKTIMQHYSLTSLRHYDSGLPTVFFDGDEVIWHGNRASKSDIINYYITQNHSKEETMEYFGLSSAALSKAIEQFNIKKTSFLIRSKSKSNKFEQTW